MRMLRLRNLQHYPPNMRASKHASKPNVVGATPAPLLRVSYPHVADLRIELDFVPEFGWYPSTQVHILHPPARAAFRYPCPFAGCTGYFELGELVTRLLEQKAAKTAGELSCTGTRPRDRSTGNLCGVTMTYRLKATYTPRDR